MCSSEQAYHDKAFMPRPHPLAKMLQGIKPGPAGSGTYFDINTGPRHLGAGWIAHFSKEGSNLSGGGSSAQGWPL